MADHPLRPATDRRLGRPLPHQLPNRTQAAPKAHHCFVPQDICGISPSFPGLSPTSGHIPTRYSPVRRSPCEARDLHVLSMPPAFTLSQDQTLRFIHHQIPKDPAAPNRPALTLLTDDFPTIPRSPDTKPNHTQGTRPSQAQHPGADRASHPLTSSPPTSHQHQGRYHSHPSAQHPAIHTGQPRTKHFQNRCTCQRTTPDRPEITSGEVTIRQSSETPLPQRANEPKAPTPARQPRITSGVAGFYGPPRTMSNGFHAVSCNALDA